MQVIRESGFLFEMPMRNGKIQFRADERMVRQRTRSDLSPDGNEAPDKNPIDASGVTSIACVAFLGLQSFENFRIAEERGNDGIVPGRVHVPQ